jgi:hypothetical protein
MLLRISISPQAWAHAYTSCDGFGWRLEIPAHTLQLLPQIINRKLTFSSQSIRSWFRSWSKKCTVFSKLVENKTSFLSLDLSHWDPEDHLSRSNWFDLVTQSYFSLRYLKLLECHISLLQNLVEKARKSGKQNQITEFHCLCSPSYFALDSVCSPSDPPPLYSNGNIQRKVLLFQALTSFFEVSEHLEKVNLPWPAQVQTGKEKEKERTKTHWFTKLESKTKLRTLSLTRSSIKVASLPSLYESARDLWSRLTHFTINNNINSNSKKWWSCLADLAEIVLPNLVILSLSGIDPEDCNSSNMPPGALGFEKISLVFQSNLYHKDQISKCLKSLIGWSPKLQRLSLSLPYLSNDSYVTCWADLPSDWLKIGKVEKSCVSIEFTGCENHLQVATHFTNQPFLRTKYHITQKGSTVTFTRKYYSQVTRKYY